jgi:hypothetical protein
MMSARLSLAASGLILLLLKRLLLLEHCCRHRILEQRVKLSTKGLLKAQT